MSSPYTVRAKGAPLLHTSVQQLSPAKIKVYAAEGPITHTAGHLSTFVNTVAGDAGITGAVVISHMYFLRPAGIRSRSQCEEGGCMGRVKDGTEAGLGVGVRWCCCLPLLVGPWFPADLPAAPSRLLYVNGAGVREASLGPLWSDTCVLCEDL